MYYISFEDNYYTKTKVQADKLTNKFNFLSLRINFFGKSFRGKGTFTDWLYLKRKEKKKIILFEDQFISGLTINFNLRKGKQLYNSQLIINRKKENNRQIRSIVRKKEMFRKIAVVKEYILEEQDESNSPNNMYDNLEGSMYQQNISPAINGSPDDVLRTTS